jgi:hypothetical protein
MHLKGLDLHHLIILLWKATFALVLEYCCYIEPLKIKFILGLSNIDIHPIVILVWRLHSRSLSDCTHF